MNNKLNKIIEQIHMTGGKVYYVGGFVRDELLNKKNKDIDLEIHDISVSKVKNILSKFGKVDEVGISFGVLKVHGLDIDFTFPRTESKIGEKHIDFEVTVDPFLSLEESARRRDFTMNSIMKNAITGEIVDLFGGQNDLKNGVIKMVDKDTFSDDPLRALRAAQFASRLNLTVDQTVIDFSKTMDYSFLSVERITEEFKKLLLSPKPSIGLTTLLEMGIIEQLFPELYELTTCEQSPKWHPEGNVWNHTLGVVDTAALLKDRVEDQLMFMYAALLHDIGKPATTEIQKDGRITARDHAKIGAKMVPSVMARFTTEKKMNKQIEFLVKNHMLAHKLMESTQKRARQLMTEGDVETLVYLSVADQFRGGEINIPIYEDLANMKYTFAKLHSLEQGEPFKILPFYQGKDLIEKGMKPGPKMGQLLKEAFQMQVSGQSKDHISRWLTNRVNNINEMA